MLGCSESTGGLPTNAATTVWRPAGILIRTCIALVRGERLADRLAGVLLVDHRRPIRVLATDRKEADPLAVERQLQLVLVRDSPDRAE